MYATNVTESAYLRRLGGAISAAMRYRNISAAEVAAGVGVSRDTVYRWCAGKHSMALPEAARLAAVLDAPADLFLSPPESWGAAMAMMAAFDELRARPAAPPPDPSRL